jgi:hypothetical protein
MKSRVDLIWGMTAIIQSKIFCYQKTKTNIQNYNLPVVLDGCGTWSLTLREEHRLRVFEYSVLRRIFGPKRVEDELWIKSYNDELHGLYSSLNNFRAIKLRRMRWAGHLEGIGEGRDVYGVLDGRPEGKRPLGRPRRRWENNTKTYLREIVIDGANWIRLAQARAFVSMVMNLRFP